MAPERVNIATARSNPGSKLTETAVADFVLSLDTLLNNLNASDIFDKNSTGAGE